MNIDQNIFKSYDIRGIYPTEINEENIQVIVRSIINFFKSKIQKNSPLSVALGMDMRLSSPSLFKSAKEIMTGLGVEIADVGLLSTPTFYFAVRHFGLDCGIQITASHNPKEYNGIKFVINSKNGLIKIGKSTGMQEVLEGTRTVPLNLEKVQSSIKIIENIEEAEIINSLSIFENPNIKRFKIAADPANAMGAKYIEELFKVVPADLVKINFELDGSFPNHQPDPLNFDNLKDLQRIVIDSKADFGLAPDGDGDRLFFIDEKGQIVPASHITALVAKELLKIHKGAKILFDIRYIMTPQKIVEENGGQYEISKVGHAFITEQMTNTGAIFAGESSAHYFYKETGNAESQTSTIICILKLLSDSGKTLSELISEVSRSFESGEINFKVSDAKKIMDEIKTKYNDADISLLDGVSVSYKDWRMNLRSSNTEPLLRLNVESENKIILDEKTKEVVEFINSKK